MMLRLIRDSSNTQKEYAQHLGVNRKKVQYEINKLLRANLISRIKQTQFFKPTITGIKWLVGYDSTDKKYQFGIENARWKSVIANRKLLSKFFFEHGFTPHQMNNWTQWIGRIDGFTIWISESAKKATMMVSHPTVYGGNILDEYNRAEERILIVFKTLNSKWNFKMPIPDPVEAMQFTSSDPVAESLMEKTSGSQIKIGKRVSFDQSYGSTPRTEFSDLPDAIIWSMIPKMVLELIQIGRKHNEDMEILKPSIVNMAKAFRIMVKTQGTISQSLRKVSDTLSGVVEKDSGKSESISKELNTDSERMYG